MKKTAIVRHFNTQSSKKIALLLFFCAFLQLSAQPILTGVTSNRNLEKNFAAEQTAQKSQITSLNLPFFDDFSYNSLYPDPAKWMDKQGFVNNSYAIRPPTRGVVTLDALDQYGKIYAHASTLTFGADTLTSYPIRLDTLLSQNRPLRIQDSLYFSFFYQPGGGRASLTANVWERIGNQPEVDDKLVLEFGYLSEDSVFNEIDSTYHPVYVWDEVWSSEGCSLDSWLTEEPLTYFKQVLIPILNEDYLRKNFQFRFRNYASLENQGHAGRASNVDQWNIDYVKLDINRNSNDRFHNDVAFSNPTTSLLKNYQSMPWKQYRASDNKSNFNNKLINLSDGQKNTLYQYVITDKNNQSVGEVVSNNYNIQPYHTDGLHNYANHVTPEVHFTASSTSGDSANFTITHLFKIVGANDYCSRNDTCTFVQKFHNYYAYDDGTAEAGLYLTPVSTSQHSSLALKFTLAQSDTLRAVRMWFNDVLNDANFDYFTLKVWDDNGGFPGNELTAIEMLLPSHAEEFSDFITYYLEEPLWVSGTFYIGFYQNNAVEINIGFDQDYEGESGFTFYNTQNQWEEMFYKGVPMMRPVLGKDLGATIHTPSVAQKLTFYPNPTQNSVSFTIPDPHQTPTAYEIHDLFGRLLKTDNLNSNLNTINLSELVAGCYFITLKNKNHSLGTGKVVKY
ncbi:MAG: T9SS type A sorting domain-containing protein [Bacteroidales bacterium]|jgi:hypothetical protein|nr:T9SS type A sorting domain-containing protein [Bacteroidales bacterium]